MTTYPQRPAPPSNTRHAYRSHRTAARWLPALLLPVGCAAPDPVALWQSRLEDHVRLAGHGDPHILRLSPLADEHGDPPNPITFSIADATVAAAPFPQRRDVRGLLLGLRPVAHRNWYVFLVAVCRAEQTAGTSKDPGPLIQHIALCAFTLDGDHFTWATAPGSPQALDRYRRARNRSNAFDTPRSLFPGRTDVFTLTITGRRVVVTHADSHADWTLDLPAPPAALASHRVSPVPPQR